MRNVGACRFPSPYAHVPVFTPRHPRSLASGGGGARIGERDAFALVGARHWWPVACETLG